MIKNTENALFCPFGAAAEKGAPNFMVQPHRATARVLDILERLAASPNGLTLTELSVDMDAPKSSLFPIVHTLEQRRYLQQEGAGILLEQKDLTADSLYEKLKNLDREELLSMAVKARALAKRGAAQTVADTIERLAK